MRLKVKFRAWRSNPNAEPNVEGEAVVTIKHDTPENRQRAVWAVDAAARKAERLYAASPWRILDIEEI